MQLVLEQQGLGGGDTDSGSLVLKAVIIDNQSSTITATADAGSLPSATNNRHASVSRLPIHSLIGDIHGAVNMELAVSISFGSTGNPFLKDSATGLCDASLTPLITRCRLIDKQSP